MSQTELVPIDSEWVTNALRRIYTQQTVLTECREVMRALLATDTTDAEQSWARREAARLVAALDDHEPGAENTTVSSSTCPT